MMNKKYIIYSLCVYSGIVWQTFTLTRYGHLVVKKLDDFLNYMVDIKKGIRVMKKLNKKVLMLVATFTTLLASIVASSACYWCVYQPKEPKCLREE